MMSSVGMVILSFYLVLFYSEVPMMLVALVFSCSAGVTFSYVLCRSTWFGVMIWLVYLSALLVLFLFFTALSPNPTLGLHSKMSLGEKMIFLFSMLLLWGGGFMGGYKSLVFFGSALSMVSLWVGQGAVFMAGLASYLFFVVVVASKLASRGGGALRMMFSKEK